MDAGSRRTYVACVILAAGSSARMGRPKQLLPYRGAPLLQHVVDSAARSGCDNLTIVLGHHAGDVEEALRLPPGAKVVINPDYRTGQASSLRAGLNALPAGADAAVVLLGDQPQVRPEVIRAVADAHREGAGPVVRAEYENGPGHPVLLGRETWSEIFGERGDTGARPVLDAHPEWIASVPVGSPAPVEVDTPEDYRVLTREDPSSPT